MLTELRIAGLGVIDDAVLPLGPGLTVVTGETGAGKTMVVTGLQLLFGARGDADRVRTGSERATVDGRIRIAADSGVAGRVRDAGGELDDDAPESVNGGTRECELIVRRTVGRNGRSRAYVGGAPAPMSVLAELADDLLALHGQADQARLVRPSAQRAALDRYAGLDLGPLHEAFDEWRTAAAALADRSARAGQLRRESDLLTHGISEIERAAPASGELDELTTLANRLGRADALTVAARTAHDALVGATDFTGDDPDVTRLLATAGRAVAQQTGADPELDALDRRLTEFAALAADLAADFGAYADALDTDPARLEQIEARRAELTALVRKYCDEPDATVAGVLRWAEAAQARLEEIDVSDDAITALRERVVAAERVLHDRAAAASTGRHAAAARLTSAVTAELRGLAMPDARLTVQVTDRAPSAGTLALDHDGERVAVGPDGFDDVAFLLAAHPGAPNLPVGRSASGGELSRVMLALEVCLLDRRAEHGAAPLLVFDEVDAGVGGRAATEVGRRLARLGRDRQVLAVTHLAQVAAHADRHIVVDKPTARRTVDSVSDDANSADGVSASDVREVAGDDRIAELARMLGGADTAAAREHAAELLAGSESAAAKSAARDSATRRKSMAKSTGRSPAAPAGPTRDGVPDGVPDGTSGRRGHRARRRAAG